MEYPVSGELSFGAFHATDEEDLVSLYKYLLETHGLEKAVELGDMFPEVFVKGYNLTLTESQLETIYLLLGFTTGRDTYEITKMIEPVLNENMIDAYDRVTYTVDSEDGLSIHIE